MESVAALMAERGRSAYHGYMVRVGRTLTQVFQITSRYGNTNASSINNYYIERATTATPPRSMQHFLLRLLLLLLSVCCLAVCCHFAACKTRASFVIFLVSVRVCLGHKAQMYATYVRACVCVYVLHLYLYLMIVPRLLLKLFRFVMKFACAEHLLSCVLALPAPLTLSLSLSLSFFVFVRCEKRPLNCSIWYF